MPGSIPDPEQFTACIAGDADAYADVADRLHDQLLCEALRLTAHLKGLDIAEDVIQEMWMNVWQMKPTDYDHRKSSPLTYLIKGALRSAARSVNEQYVPPGNPKRPRKDAEGHAITPRPAISLDGAMSSATGEGVARRVDVLEDTGPAVAAVACDKVDVSQFLVESRTMVAMPVYGALRSIYRDDLDRTEAAETAGISRFVLWRACKALSSWWAA